MNMMEYRYDPWPPRAPCITSGYRQKLLNQGYMDRKHLFATFVCICLSSYQQLAMEFHVSIFYSIFIVLRT